MLVVAPLIHPLLLFSLLPLPLLTVVELQLLAVAIDAAVAHWSCW